MGRLGVAVCENTSVAPFTSDSRFFVACSNMGQPLSAEVIQYGVVITELVMCGRLTAEVRLRSWLGPRVHKHITCLQSLRDLLSLRNILRPQTSTQTGVGVIRTMDDILEV